MFTPVEASFSAFCFCLISWNESKCFYRPFYNKQLRNISWSELVSLQLCTMMRCVGHTHCWSHVTKLTPPPFEWQMQVFTPIRRKTFFKTGFNSNISGASKTPGKLGKHLNLKKKLYSSHFTLTAQKSLQMCLEDSVFNSIAVRFLQNILQKRCSYFKYWL